MGIKSEAIGRLVFLVGVGSACLSLYMYAYLPATNLVGQQKAAPSRQPAKAPGVQLSANELGSAEADVIDRRLDILDKQFLFLSDEDKRKFKLWTKVALAEEFIRPDQAEEYYASLASQADQKIDEEMQMDLTETTGE